MDKNSNLFVAMWVNDLWFKTEAAGLATRFAYLIIKVIHISYSNLDKTGAWKHYAAATAAALAKVILSFLGLGFL
jgi:hypothetical protein